MVHHFLSIKPEEIICENPFFQRKTSRAPGCQIEAMQFPKGFSCRPVLIHVNGVTDELIDSDYFAAIIDMGDMIDASVSE